MGDGIGHAEAVRQLALPFAHQPRFERAAFVAAPSNAEALAWLPLGACGRWPDGRLALWGAAGTGKTHLLHVWDGERGALLLPGTALRDLPALFGAGMRWGGIAVDDADEWADEAALLHLLNASREMGLPLLLAGRAPPARWNSALPDLRSRLRAIQPVGLRPPDESLLRMLLVRLLVERQLGVAQGVIDWLLARLPRTAASMREAARRLDEAALASGRGVTRPLAAGVLAEMLALPDEETEREPIGVLPNPGPPLPGFGSEA